MLLHIFLSTSTHITTTLQKSPSPILMQYLMMLMMGGAAFLSKKQLRKATRKMKWELFKQSFKNVFKSDSKKGKVIGRILLILLIGGLLTWGLYALVGKWGFLLLLYAVIRAAGASRSTD